MFRVWVLAFLWLNIHNVCIAASSLYQVNLIVFTRQQIPIIMQETLIPSLFSLNDQNLIALKSEPGQPKETYRLLPKTHSLLENEYWTLHHQPQYKVLMHYTWLQPKNSDKIIAIPSSDHDEWHIEGTIQVKQGAYYSLKTELMFSANENQKNHFVLSQQQQLKPDTLYYLDDTNAGMLIKIHPIA